MLTRPVGPMGCALQRAPCTVGQPCCSDGPRLCLSPADGAACASSCTERRAVSAPPPLKRIRLSKPRLTTLWKIKLVLYICTDLRALAGALRRAQVSPAGRPRHTPSSAQRAATYAISCTRPRPGRPEGNQGAMLEGTAGARATPAARLTAASPHTHAAIDVSTHIHAQT